MWNLEKWYRWSYVWNRNGDMDIQKKHIDTEGGKGGDELGDWDWHIYTIDNMYKIDN